jgi:hypothetical protein
MKAKIMTLLIIGTVSITSVLSGCSKSNNNVANINIEEKLFSAGIKTDNSNKDLASSDKLKEYEMISKTYNKNNVEISYPQIKNYNDASKLNLINKDLEDEALSILNMYTKDDPNLNNLTMEVNYEVKFKNDKYISIAYTGYSNVKGAAYPTSVFYTTNIDLEKGSSIELSDYADINDILKKLKDLNNVKALSNENEVAEEQKSVLLNIDNDELLSILKDADFHKVNGRVEVPQKGAYSYIEENNVVISLPVIHAIGDHAEFLILK